MTNHANTLYPFDDSAKPQLLQNEEEKDDQHYALF